MSGTEDINKRSDHQKPQSHRDEKETSDEAPPVTDANDLIHIRAQDRTARSTRLGARRHQLRQRHSNAKEQRTHYGDDETSDC
jgi:hypothetical protein